MNKWHVLTILALSLLWTAGVVVVVVCVYVFALSDVKDVEIRAVALTASIFVGFLLIRLPMAIFRGLFASYVVLPLMGFGARSESTRHGRLFAAWIRMLHSLGWTYDLTESPAYEEIAKGIRDELKKIERKLPDRRPYVPVQSVQIINRHSAFDVGEEWIQGRVVDLSYFDDQIFLRQLSAGARSESVRRSARRRLAALQNPPVDGGEGYRP